MNLAIHIPSALELAGGLCVREDGREPATVELHELGTRFFGAVFSALRKSICIPTIFDVAYGSTSDGLSDSSVQH